MSFCMKCGANMPDGTKFCPSCGTQAATAAPVATEVKASPAVSKQKKLHCPHCKSENISISTESSVSGAVTTSTGSGLFAATSVSNTHRNFWFCGDCGSKFRNIQNLEEEITKVKKDKKVCKIAFIISFVISIFVAVWIATSDIADMMFMLLAGGAIILIPFITAVVTFIFIFVYKSRITKFETELAFLKQNCFN